MRTFSRSRKLFTLSRLASLCMAAALLIVGCSSSAPTATTKHVLVFGSSSTIPQLNPIIITFAYEQTLWSLLWDGLVESTPSGTPAPDLATSWSPAPDLKSWKFNLRHGVKFNSGRELTSDDVVKTIQYFIDPKVPAQWFKYNALISGAQAIDKYTVEVDTSAPDASLPITLEAFQVIDMTSLSTINQKPNGTGPYMVKEFVPNDHVKLLPNPNYWGPKPKLDEIDIVKTGDPTAAITDLKSDAIQGFWGPPLTAIADLAATPGLSVVYPQAPAKAQEIGWDTTSFPFNDVRARQAFSYATDRDTILKVAYAGIGTTSPANDYLSSKNVQFDSSLTPYTFDLAKAKQLFDAVGVKHLIWWAIAGAYPEWTTEGQIISADLAKIGIKMEVQTNDLSTWVAKFYPAHKKFPGYLVADALEFYGPAAFAFSFLYGGANSDNWQNADYDNAYVAAQAAADTTAQQNSYNQLQEIQNSQVPVVVTNQTVDPVPVSSKVSGVWVGANGTVHLELAAIS
jgi:peptide/nickel transport system substrate-binding protein